MRGRYMMVRLPVCLYKALKARASEAGVKPRHYAAACLVALMARARQLDKKKREEE